MMKLVLGDETRVNEAVTGQNAPGGDDPAFGNYTVPSLARAIKVLRHVGQNNGCTNITRTAKTLGINRTTLIRILHTLRKERMIEWRGDGEGYALGVGLIWLAAGAAANRDVLRTARPRLADLARQTGLSAHLGMLDGRDVVYLVREVPSAHLVSNVHEGTRLPAHATTMGRILLAHLSEEALDALYGGTSMQGYSKVTATSLAALKRQLHADRDHGRVWSDGNFEPSIGSCAYPVRDQRGAVVAAINLSGPVAEFVPGTPKAQAIDAAIRGAADDISEACGWENPQ